VVVEMWFHRSSCHKIAVSLERPKRIGEDNIETNLKKLKGVNLKIYKQAT